MTAMRRAVAAAAAGALLTAGLAGCSKEVDNGKVEGELVRILKERAPNEKYGKVECHDDLKAEVGEKSDCDIEINGSTIKYDARVSSVEGNTVKFEFTKG